jgi:4-hydroxy-2-oxoheptanedioate aldolase
MNRVELQMVNLLTELKQEYNVTGIKAEFEAEGTRLEEAMRLKDVTSTAGLNLNIKIGGCEAIKDMLDAISLGAERIIAPMVETPYALQKFIRAAKLVYGSMLDTVELLINIETITACENFLKMLQVPEMTNLNGVVIGRVDLAGSLGLSREQINSSRILGLTSQVAVEAKKNGLKVVVGGGVSVDALPFFKQMPVGSLDRFETRKVIFQCPAALSNPEKAFLKAVEFELLWLKNKRDYYAAISQEDSARIELMEKRYRSSIEKISNKEKAA